MGVPINVRGWREAAGADVLARLAGDLALFVVDDPDRPGVVAPCGAGTTRRLRGPRNLTAAVGYVQWISTDPW